MQDMMMPEMDGCTATRLILKHYEDRNNEIAQRQAGAGNAANILPEPQHSKRFNRVPAIIAMTASVMEEEQ